MCTVHAPRLSSQQFLLSCSFVCFIVFSFPQASIKEGMTILAVYKPDRLWYKAKVLRVEKDTVSLRNYLICAFQHVLNQTFSFSFFAFSSFSVFLSSILKFHTFLHHTPSSHCLFFTLPPIPLSVLPPAPLSLNLVAKVDVKYDGYEESDTLEKSEVRVCFYVCTFILVYDRSAPCRRDRARYLLSAFVFAFIQGDSSFIIVACLKCMPSINSTPLLIL